MSDMSVLLGAVVFLASLAVFTSGISGVDEGSVIERPANVTDSACGNLTNSSTASDVIGCGTDSVGSFVSLATLESDNTYLNTIYYVLGGIIILFVLIYVVIPLAVAIAEAIPL